jgi:hypothetical protein
VMTVASLPFSRKQARPYQVISIGPLMVAGRDGEGAGGSAIVVVDGTTSRLVGATPAVPPASRVSSHPMTDWTPVAARS